VRIKTVNLSGEQILTKRNAEVLELYLQGKTSGQVADALYVTTDNVHWHVTKSYDILRQHSGMQIKNKQHAIVALATLGMIEFQSLYQEPST
jgi:DNA-binding CsgD family transcriptional regulator